MSPAEMSSSTVNKSNLKDEETSLQFGRCHKTSQVLMFQYQTARNPTLEKPLANYLPPATSNAIQHTYRNALKYSPQETAGKYLRLQYYARNFE